MKGDAGERRSFAHAPPSVFCPFQKTSIVPEGMEYTPNRVKGLARSVTQPDCSKDGLPAATPCRLQLCTVLGARLTSNPSITVITRSME
jgi:hypothetical protein